MVCPSDKNFYSSVQMADQTSQIIYLPVQMVRQTVQMPQGLAPLRTEFPVFWEFLGIPRNSQKFPTMQISSDSKSLELLGISGKGRLQFCEDLESLGIPRNSQLYKLPII